MDLGILKVSVMVENAKETSTKRRSQTFYKSMDVQSVTNAMDDSVPSIYT